MSQQPIQPRNDRESLRHARAYTPRVDVFENQDELLLFVDLPGVAKDALTIHVEKGTLSLEARVTPRGNGATRLAGERRAEAFERAFSLPEGIDVDRIAVELKDGVASIHLPKAEKAKPRRIPIG